VSVRDYLENQAQLFVLYLQIILHLENFLKITLSS